MVKANNRLCFSSEFFSKKFSNAAVDSDAISLSERGNDLSLHEVGCELRMFPKMFLHHVYPAGFQGIGFDRHEKRS